MAMINLRQVVIASDHLIPDSCRGWIPSSESLSYLASLFTSRRLDQGKVLMDKIIAQGRIIFALAITALGGPALCGDPLSRSGTARHSVGSGQSDFGWTDRPGSLSPRVLASL
jgi:hypothetical protein